MSRDFNKEQENRARFQQAHATADHAKAEHRSAAALERIAAVLERVAPAEPDDTDTAVRLTDDQIMAGYRAVRDMLVMRVGDRAAHANAFREAVKETP